MSNKSRLQTNNTNLQALIDKANTLPDAGGSGGGVETCEITVSVWGKSSVLPVTMFYVDANGHPTSDTGPAGSIEGTYAVTKGSIVVFDTETDSSIYTSGNITVLNYSPMTICGVTGDGVIDY